MDNLYRALINGIWGQTQERSASASAYLAAAPMRFPDVLAARLPDFEELQKELEEKKFHWFELPIQQCKNFWDHDWYAGPGFYHAHGTSTVGPFPTEDEVICHAYLTAKRSLTDER